MLGRSWDRAERYGASLGCAAVSAQVPGMSFFQLYPKFCWGPEWDQSMVEVSEGAFGKGRNSSKKKRYFTKSKGCSVMLSEHVQ